MNENYLGKQINLVRKDRGLTSDKLSEQCHINAAYLRQIESGRKMPSLKVFIDICNALKISPSYLLKDVLEENELRDFEAIAKLWETATPKQIEMVLAMIRAATLESIE